MAIYQDTSTPEVTLRKPLFIQETSSREILPIKQSVVLRRSIFFVIAKVVAIEIFFDLLFVALKLPSMIIVIPTNILNELSTFYIFVFVLFNALKVFFIILIGLKWITCSYEITDKEIKEKCGMIYKKEKSFLYFYTLEVSYAQTFFGRIFNFGSIEIHNPILKEILRLEAVPNPSKYTDIIKKNILNRMPQQNLVPFRV